MIWRKARIVSKKEMNKNIGMVLYDLEKFEAVLWENMAGKTSRLERPGRWDTKTSLSHILSQLNFWLKKYRICKKVITLAV